MITAHMNKVEIYKQMWAVNDESTVVKACYHKFCKACRKLPKGRVVMTRRFFHKETNQAYVICMSQYKGLAACLMLAEVDHGSQKWYYLISEDLTDTTDIYSAHFFKRYAEREGIPYDMPNVITHFFMMNRNVVKIYESEDESQLAYASRNGITLCRFERERGITKHCTYVSRDMLGELQEKALQAILGDIDDIEDIQRGFTSPYNTTLKDVERHRALNHAWANSIDTSSQVACAIYKQYFEDVD